MVLESNESDEDSDEEDAERQRRLRAGSNVPAHAAITQAATAQQSQNAFVDTNAGDDSDDGSMYSDHD